MDDKEYFGLHRLSASGAKTLLKSPARYKHELEMPAAKKPELVFGNLFHTLVLEPEQFELRYAIAPDVDRRTKEGKDAYARFQFNAVGLEVVSAEDYERACRMAEAVKSQAGHLFQGGKAEVPVLWERDGVPLKAKMDYVSDCIVDLKSTSADDEEGLVRAAWTYGYHISAAAYQEAAEVLTGKKLNKWFVFCTKSEPHEVVVLKASDEFLARGRAKWDAAIRLYQACREFDNWPGLASRFEGNELNPPRWA
jgi:hypothetical protein